MATLKHYDMKGNELEGIEISLDENLEVHTQLIKDYIDAIRKNARQWSANTKTRKEVKCTSKKPFRQKGTGNARQGYLAAPHYTGGGVVNGPKPKFDQHVRINKKERRQAVRYILSEKIKAGEVAFIKDECAANFEKPQTKAVAQFLDKAHQERKSTLFLAPTHAEGGIDVGRENFGRSVKNIPKTFVTPIANMNAYDLLAKGKKMFVFDSALEELKKIVESK